MSKRSKACDIKQSIKEIVWIRDNQKCIFCGKWVPVSCSNAHFIKRSQGGLGIPQNIVTLCPGCHYQEDFGRDTKLYEEHMENYLKSIYGENWDKEKLIYKKWR